MVTLQTFYLGKHDLLTVYLGKLDFLNVACSAGVFFERAICSRKRHVETSRREEEMGRVKILSVTDFSLGNLPRGNFIVWVLDMSRGQ